MQIPEYNNSREDNWYLHKGVKPPERQSHGVSEDEIDSLIAKNNAGHVHVWKQHGPEIRCTSGQYEHGQNIGVHKRLIGTGEKGEPLLKEI